MDDIEKGNALKQAAETLTLFAKTYTGEHKDITGCGLWMIFCTNLEMIMECKVITNHQYDFFVKIHKDYAALQK